MNFPLKRWSFSSFVCPLLLKPRKKQVELEALPPIDVENHQLLPCFTHPEVWSFNIPHLHPLKCLHLITIFDSQDHCYDSPGAPASLLPQQLWLRLARARRVSNSLRLRNERRGPRGVPVTTGRVVFCSANAASWEI